jgi:hypothetical protein
MSIIAISLVGMSVISLATIPMSYMIEKRNNDESRNTIIIPLEQNRIKVVNMLKFMSRCNNGTKNRFTSISIDRVEYKVSIDIIHVMYHTVGITLKVIIDTAGNVRGVTASIYKKNIIFGTSDKIIAVFNNFVQQF